MTAKIYTLQRIWKRLLAAALALVLTVTLIDFPAATETEAAEYLSFYEKPLPVSSLDWAFQENFTYAKVWQSGKLNTSMVSYGGFIQETKATAYVKTSAPSGVQAVAPYTVVTGLSATVPSSKPYVLYHDIGTVEDGGETVHIDMKVTLTGWKLSAGSAQENAYVMFGTCSYDAGGEHDGAAVGIWPSANVQYIDLTYTFYESGTSNQYSFDGSFSLVDLDYEQYFQVTADSGIHLVLRDAFQYLVRDKFDKADHITMRTSGSTATVQASDAGVTPKDSVTVDGVTKEMAGAYEAGYVTFEFEKQDSVSFRFGSAQVADTVNSTSLGHYYYGILPYSVGSYEAPTPSKYVTAGAYDPNAGGTLADNLTLKSGQRDLSYVVSVYVPRSLSGVNRKGETYNCNYGSFSISDTMNTVYDAASAAKKTRIWQMQSDGSWMDVSSWFTIEADADSNTISAAAKDSTISEDNEVDFFGHTYYMVICTEIKSSVTMERLAALVKDDKNNITYSSSLYVIPNSASCTAGVYNPYDQTYAQATYKEETNESNTVYVHFTEPSLSIVKTVDGASSVEVSKGDTVHYLITVKQTTKGATAQNIVVQDVSLKNSGTIVIDADSVTAKVGSTVYSSGVTVKDNTVSFALSKLAYGQTVTIAYDAVVKKAVSRLANTAAAVADDTDMVTATAVVSAGEPGLAVEKYVSKDYSASGNDTSNYQNGDYADYQIVVYSADGNAAARNVVLTDAWDAGLSVLDDTVQVYYTTNASNYTDTSKAVKLTQGTDYTISAVSSRKYAIAFQGAYADLGGDGFGAYLITYSAKVASAGTSSITTLTNTATASSDNTEDVSAAASISLSNLPKASITKEVDVEEAALGDSITYTVTLTNTGGVSLEDWSLYDTSVNGTAFDGFTLQSVTAAYYHNISGAVYGWESLYSGDNDWYFSYPGTRGWKLFCGSALSDTLGVGEAIRVTAVYTTDRAAATDTRIVNTACYSATGRNSSNTIEGEAAATVRLVKPVLKLTKTSDADTYSDSNSMATYTLTVEQDDAQERKDMTAYNVMINDALPASARFTGSYTVKKVGTDGSATDITKQSSGGAGYSCSISGDALARTSVLTETAGSSRFLGIDTGADLAYGEKLIITYTVSLANAASSVETVTNTATAEALNADEVQTTHTVQMTMPVLAVTKSADKGTYALGDTATYYVRITQTEDAEAYEITCKDFIDPTEIPLSGAFYNAIHDIVVTDSSGTVLTKNTDYTIVSYRSSTENGMELYFDESLSLAQGESFTIAYQVDLTDEAWLTQTNENTVQASAWNADSVSATADMLVEKAQLAISKTVDAYEYERGDTAVFTVSVTAVAKADVEDLVLRDMIDNTSVSAQWFEESLQALAVYDTDGIALSEDMYTVTYLGGGYVLSFEEPLSYGESYTVEYAVLLHDSGLWNVDTVNTATANASNAERVSAAATVTVTATPYTEVRITKKILAADINFANGDPMFVFHLTGTDKTGQEISLRRVIDFTEEYVEKHTDADGYVQLTAVFETLLPGVYTVSEDKTLRYRFQDIVSVSPYGAVNGETVVFDVSAVTEDVTVSATFRNEKEEWQFYTDTDIAVNQFHTDAAE